MWERTVDGRVLTFRLFGINNQNFIMRDEETGTWWQQVTGLAIQGALKGRRLTGVGHDEVSFESWGGEQPGGRVLKPGPGSKGDYEDWNWEKQMKRVRTVVAKGKGDARWHKKADRLFLGIDHTAIVVADTEASLAFYRDRLGLKVAGESENHGTEQEHLSNVFGARLRITTLRATKGPGIELLEYLTPRDGRPTPPDSRANDL